MINKKLYVGYGPHGEPVVEIILEPEPPIIIKVCGV